VQELLPRALEVRVDPDLLPDRAGAGTGRPAARAGRSASELFSEYLTARGHEDESVLSLFQELYGEVSTV
jgi:exonuclease SbcD